MGFVLAAIIIAGTAVVFAGNIDPLSLISMGKYSFRAKEWGWLGDSESSSKNVVLRAGESYWAAFQISFTPPTYGVDLKIESFYILALNAKSFSGREGPIGVEITLYADCQSDTICEAASVRLFSQVLYLQKDSLASTVWDIGPWIQLGKIYRVQIKNAGKIDAIFGSFEYLWMGCFYYLTDPQKSCIT